MPPSAVYSSLADSSRWCIHKAYQAVSMDFHPRLKQPPKVTFYARVSSRVPCLYLKNKQPNLAFLSGRLTSSNDLASYAQSRSSSVQRSFFSGDIIAITSWAPDVVNLVRPIHKRTLINPGQNPVHDGYNLIVSCPDPTQLGVGVKPGLWTLDWTMDWTMD